ncbi:hypothetical protein [Streptomyces sp. NPDC059063]|uniref:hypothetical protein n=1 Tax=unclassified Streptomyces TaxID=2593676 RepID=UPI0036AE1CBC
MAVRHSARHAPLYAFSGLADDAHFLCEAGATDASARRWAKLCADLMEAHADGADGAPHLGTRLDFAACTPGVLAGLLYVRCGVPNPWLLPGDFAPQTEGDHASHPANHHPIA